MFHSRTVPSAPHVQSTGDGHKLWTPLAPYASEVTALPPLGNCWGSGPIRAACQDGMSAALHTTPA